MLVAVVRVGVDLVVPVLVFLLASRRVVVLVRVLVLVWMIVLRAVRMGVVVRMGMIVRVLVHRVLLVRFRADLRTAWPHTRHEIAGL
jgi:hypothetical protein